MWCWNIYEYERMNKICKTQRTFKSLFVEIFHGPNVSSQMESYKQNSRLCRSITWFHSVAWIPFTLSLYILLPWWKSDYSATSIFAKWGFSSKLSNGAIASHKRQLSDRSGIFDTLRHLSVQRPTSLASTERTESTFHLFNFYSLIFPRTFYM